MRKVFLLGCISLSLFACKNNQQAAPLVKGAATEEKDNTVYPYKATYSSDVVIGDHQNTQKVLTIYKDYDNGDLLAHKELFADTVTFDFSNGKRVRGDKETILKHIQEERSKLASAENQVDIFMPSYVRDKDHNWVNVWTLEIDKQKDGKTDSVFLNENWQLNKEGKIKYMVQLAAKPAH